MGVILLHIVRFLLGSTSSFYQNYFRRLYKTAVFDFNKINTAWLMTSIRLDAVIFNR